MRVVMLLGWPGVGKTALGHALTRRTGFPLLDHQLTYEPIVRFLAKGGHHAHQLNAQLRESIVNMLLAAGTPGIVVTSSIRHQPVTDSTRRIVQMALRHGARIDFVRVECSWDEHKRRVSHPSRRRHPKTTTIRELKLKMASPCFMGLPGHPPLVIDSTTLSAAGCANRIIRTLGLVRR